MQTLEVAKAVLPSVVALSVGILSSVTSMQVMKAQLPAEVESRYRLASIDRLTQDVPKFLAATDRWFGHLTLNIPLQCGEYDAWMAESQQYRRESMEAYYNVSAQLNLAFRPDQSVNATAKELLDFVDARQIPTMDLREFLCASIGSNVNQTDTALDSRPSGAGRDDPDKRTHVTANLKSNYFDNYQQYNVLNHRHQDAVSEWISTSLRTALEF